MYIVRYEKKKTNKQIVRHRLSLRRHRNSSSFSAACRTVHLRTRLSIYSALHREGVSEPTPALGRHPFIHKSRCAMVFLPRQPDPYNATEASSLLRLFSPMFTSQMLHQRCMQISHICCFCAVQRPTNVSVAFNHLPPIGAVSRSPEAPNLACDASCLRRRLVSEQGRIHGKRCA